MAAKSSLEKNTRYLNIIWKSVVIVGLLLAGVEAYWSQGSAIERNASKISYNLEKITDVKNDIYSQDRKQNVTLQKMIIQITRLETRIISCKLK